MSDRDGNGMAWLVTVVLSLVLLAAALVITAARAHDHSRPSLDEWYGTLTSGQGPCCGGPSVDARTLDGAEWGREGNHYWVIIDDVRHVVPDNAVLNQPNLDGRTLVWPIT